MLKLSEIEEMSVRDFNNPYVYSDIREEIFYKNRTGKNRKETFNNLSISGHPFVAYSLLYNDLNKIKELALLAKNEEKMPDIYRELEADGKKRLIRIM
ncbi:hypothetical protein [Acetobacter persici]|uniref:hypothetical protein n=1 Tax=Acetobacter persici TaxID=1076596 RepID=UPI001BAD325A|nr:hypothetical protein [Acetobacter persici]MBS1017239.1 hypothetical protein [Acetobacter persici]